MASRHPHAPPSPFGLATSWGVVFALLVSGVVACGMTVRGVPGSPDGGACELRADGVCAATQPEGVCGARAGEIYDEARRCLVTAPRGVVACHEMRDSTPVSWIVTCAIEPASGQARRVIRAPSNWPELVPGGRYQPCDQDLTSRVVSATRCDP